MIRARIDRFTLQGAHGWAWNPDKKDRIVNIHAISQGIVIASAAANIYRSDIEENGIGNGFYGFSIKFKRSFDLYTNISFVAILDDEKIRIEVPSLTFIEGFVEYLSPQRVVGWVLYPRSLGLPMSIEAMISNRVVGRANRELSRPVLVEIPGNLHKYDFAIEFDEVFIKYDTTKVRVNCGSGSVILPRADYFRLEKLATVLGTNAEERLKTLPVHEGVNRAQSLSVETEGSVDTLSRCGVFGSARLDPESQDLLQYNTFANEVSIGRGQTTQLVYPKKISSENANAFETVFDLPKYGRISPALVTSPSIATEYTSLSDFRSDQRKNVSNTFTAISVQKQTIKSQSREVAFATAQPLNQIDNLRGYPGKRQERPNRPRILLVAHFVGEYSFGSERSFIDMIEALDNLQFNVIAALPHNNCDYTNIIRAKTLKVLIVNYQWWRDIDEIDYSVVEVFKQIILQNRISIVHINTIMLRESAVAARQCRVPAIVHVRELVTNDVQLCDLIGLKPAEIIERVKQRADYIIANSAATAAAFHKPNKIFAIPNTIAIEAFSKVRRCDGLTLKIGLISSNIEKKGVIDFSYLSILAAREGLNVEFLLIGPETELTKSLKNKQLTSNDLRLLSFPGYAKTSIEAIAQVDVIVNFSHFTESFGRTVLEAMASYRPVIAYDWGALRELVKHGKNGYLIPYRRAHMALPFVREMCEDRERVEELGKQGYLIAQNYDFAIYKQKFKEAYSNILSCI